MTLGLAPTQGDLLRTTVSYCEGRVAEDSIYAVLHRECFSLFPDEMFADLFTDVGRRSVPPMIVAVVMVLQRIEGCSDREAVDRFSFDARWKYAAGGLAFVGDTRLTVRPRRARCAGCGRTQVLLPAALSVRRADAVEVIGTALAAKAAGSGYRTIAALLGRPVSTVRRWLRRVPETHARWLCDQAVQHAFRLDPDILARPKPWPSTLGWGLNILAGAALAHQQRVEPDLPPWTLIGLFTRGNLLSPPLRT